MRDRRIDRLAEELAEPLNALAFDDVIRVEHALDTRNRGDVPADDNRRCRRVLPDEAAHPPGGNGLRFLRSARFDSQCG